MFVRFRSTATTLQVSLVETSRTAGKVHHSHVAGFGSVPIEPSVADRVAFWTKLHRRLGGLANQVTGAAQGEILAAVHARIPMPTPEDQEAAQTETARNAREANSGTFDILRDKHLGLAQAYRDGAEKAQAAAEAVGELRDRVRQPADDVGREVEGRRHVAADLRHCRDLAAVVDALGKRWGEDRVFDMAVKAQIIGSDRAGRAMVRLLKKLTAPDEP